MSNVWIKSGSVKHAAGATTTAFTSNETGKWVFKDSPNTTFQATLTGSGALTATVTIECSNDGLYALSTTLGVISLTGTDAVSDGFVTSNAPWKYVRAVVSSLTGTGASVLVTMGV